MRHGSVRDPHRWKWLATALKVAGDILDFADFFVADGGFHYDEAALDKRLRKPAGARELLAKYRDVIACAEPFDAQPLEQLTHEFVASNSIKIGDIVHAVRVAVTGKGVGFGLFDTLAILGRERCLAGSIVLSTWPQTFKIVAGVCDPGRAGNPASQRPAT